jgi:hypothetical protein
VRIRPDGVEGLELWDLVVPEGGVISDHIGRPAFAGILERAIDSIRTAAALTRSGKDLRRAAGFDQVVVTGGGVGQPFFFEEGGFALGGPDALVVDLGQTSVKVSRAGHPRARIDRGSPSESAKALLGKGMASSGSNPPPVAVVGLPAELDDEGVPGPSTYDDLTGNAKLVETVLAGLGWTSTRALVLNDAELAAATVALRAPPGKTLVLTIGFGVGGALVRK